VIVSVSPEAERELIDAAFFYAEQANTELGLAFIAEFERTLAILREHPNLGAPWRAMTRRFPLIAFFIWSRARSCGSSHSHTNVAGPATGRAANSHCCMRPNLSLNPDASPAALRAVRSAPVSLVR